MHLSVISHSLCPQPYLAEEGFFLGLGPWPNVDVDIGFPVFYSPHILKGNFLILKFRRNCELPQI